jgi:carbonic anhydrase
LKFLALMGWAVTAHAAGGFELSEVNAAVAAILAGNQAWQHSHHMEYFGESAGQQHPRATVVTCSDARVQTNALSKDATNELYVVRDLGNQIGTAEGSVAYGVRQLHTPLLLIVGHSVCPAIIAAAGDTSKLEPAIQKELAGITIPKGMDPTNGALLNINNQVEAAMLKFSGEIEAGRLAVIGAFYDFRNDLKQGAGKLIVTNINGESEPTKIRQLLQKKQFFKYAFMH